jgi:hypothetical protein
MLYLQAKWGVLLWMSCQSLPLIFPASSKKLQVVRFSMFLQAVTARLLSFAAQEVIASLSFYIEAITSTLLLANTPHHHQGAELRQTVM